MDIQIYEKIIGISTQVTSLDTHIAFLANGMKNNSSHHILRSFSQSLIIT